jgi:hypothetical protein
MKNTIEAIAEKNNLKLNVPVVDVDKRAFVVLMKAKDFRKGVK